MIRKDDKDLSNIILIDGEGNQKNIVQKLYIDGEGNQHEIFTSGKVIFLGTSPKSIQSLVKDWQSKTINNFYVYAGTSRMDFSENAGWEEHLYWLTLHAVESYSNGTANFYFRGHNSYSYQSLAYVDKPEKLISLGNGTSWNIRGLYPTKYHKLTNDNFLIRVGTWDKDEDTGRNGQTMNGSVQIIKSYNADTGIFTCYVQRRYYTESVNAWMYFGKHK